MFHLISVIIVSACLLHVHAFVLLQVKRVNDSVSKVDALIHKTVANEKVDELKNKLAQKDNDKTQLGRKMTLESAGFQSQIVDDRSMESIVLSGVKNLIAHDKSPNLVGNIAKKILNFVYKNAGPILRTRENDKNVIDSDIVELESGEPSMLFQVDGNKILQELMEALQSKTFHGYVNNFTRRAAKAYLTLQDNVENGNKKV